MKSISYFVLLFAISFGVGWCAGDAQASERNKYEPMPGPQGPMGEQGPIGPQGPAGTDGIDGAIGPAGHSPRVDNDDFNAISAMAFALSNAHFDHDTYNHQVAIGTGYDSGVSAGSISYAKRVCPNCPSRPLISINASMSNQSSSGGVGAGISFEIP